MAHVPATGAAIERAVEAGAFQEAFEVALAGLSRRQRVCADELLRYISIREWAPRLLSGSDEDLSSWMTWSYSDGDRLVDAVKGRLRHEKLITTGNELRRSAQAEDREVREVIVDTVR